jgi:segregation and condensation protein B
MDDITREPGADPPRSGHGRWPDRSGGADGDDARAHESEQFWDSMSAEAQEGARFALPDPDPGEISDAELEAVARDADLPEDEPAEPPPLADPAAVARVLAGILLLAREPVSFLRLAQAANCTQQMVRDGLDALAAQLSASGLPVELAIAGESARILTSADLFPYLQRWKGIARAERLSPAALETLAVVAYRQPVMRSEIEAIRGVKAGPMLRTLLEHKLIAIVGRAEVPGRPLQYGTTQKFLDRFGLRSLADLPSPKEMKALGG